MANGTISTELCGRSRLSLTVENGDLVSEIRDTLTGQSVTLSLMALERLMDSRSFVAGAAQTLLSTYAVKRTPRLCLKTPLPLSRRPVKRRLSFEDEDTIPSSQPRRAELQRTPIVIEDSPSEQDSLIIIGVSPMD